MSSSNIPSSSTAAGGPCGACKFLRRKCVAGCIFAPYFDSEQGAAHFAAVHKVFGASNVSKLLLHIPVQKRLDAVLTISYEAQARLRDPVYGCVAHIFALQQQVVNLQAELSYLQAHLTTLDLPTPPTQLIPPPATLSIADLPTSSAMPATYDLSSLFDQVAMHPSWTLHQRQSEIDTCAFSTTATTRVQPEIPSFAASSGGGGGDLQELARELLNRHAPPVVPCRNQASTLPPHSR
ncbi:hypothetical protein DH2020_023239 [Rehmannia glutinosa]|uniref:LOB domain-containing protein n=1 Tax=Rehmannia glutinosa TaxID=99300 RepID=A0ABR0W8D6_REHGL